MIDVNASIGKDKSTIDNPAKRFLVFGYGYASFRFLDPNNLIRSYVV